MKPSATFRVSVISVLVEHHEWLSRSSKAHNRQFIHRSLTKFSAAVVDYAVRLSRACKFAVIKKEYRYNKHAAIILFDSFGVAAWSGPGDRPCFNDFSILLARILSAIELVWLYIGLVERDYTLLFKTSHADARISPDFRRVHA